MLIVSSGLRINLACARPWLHPHREIAREIETETQGERQERKTEGL